MKMKVTMNTISQSSNEMLEAELARQLAKGRKQNAKLVKAVEQELESRKSVGVTGPMSREQLISSILGY